MARADLSKLAGTTWNGTGELWLDPLGNEAHRYECTMTIDDSTVRYTWSYEGKEHQGVYTLRDSGITWTDSWHQSKLAECTELPTAWGLFAHHYKYSAGEGPEWGWRTVLSQRPSGELVLQMTNITSWGEEARAVRMIFTPKA